MSAGLTVGIILGSVAVIFGLMALAYWRGTRATAASDRAVRAKVTTKDALERKEIEAELKRKRDREIPAAWAERFGDPDQ